MMDRAELIRRIAGTAYLEGRFTLRSGRTSDYYLDKYRFETQPDILQAIGEAMAEYVRPTTTLLGGPELGGVALAAATALVCRLPFIIIRNSRKDYGTGTLIEGLIGPTDRVLLLEDIATSGGQVLEAAETIRRSGAAVERIVAVIDREEGARPRIESSGFEFHALLTAAQVRAARR